MILILGPEAAGKTTSYVGEEEFGVTGLKPENTLIIVGSKKGLDEKSVLYNMQSLEEISNMVANSKDKVLKDGPVPFNYLGVNSESDDLELLYKYIQNAAKFGLRMSKDKITPLTTLIIDDLQSYINNSFYMSDLGKKDQFVKFDNVAKATLWLLDVLKGIEFSRLAQKKYDTENRLDICAFMHITLPNVNADPGPYNKYELKYAGSIMKSAYPLLGDFSIVLQTQNYKLRTKAWSGNAMIRTRPGMFAEEFIPLDLAIVKDAISKTFNKIKEAKNGKETISK